MITSIHSVPADSDTERPTPRWALLVAYAVPWVVLPSSLWRLPFAFNFDMGQIDPNAPTWHWFVIPYVFGLSLLSEGLALLTLGLVRRWGEVAPSWIPLIGDKRIPSSAAIGPAALGGLALTLLWGSMPLAMSGVGGFSRLEYSNGWWNALAIVCSAPLMLWGPMLLAVTYAYYVRRCRPGAGGRGARATGPCVVEAGGAGPVRQLSGST